MTLLTILSRGDHSLIGAARKLLDENQPGAAVIVAQAAVETAMEQSLERARQSAIARGLTVPKRRAVISYSPTNPIVRRVWSELTGDSLEGSGWWTSYETLIQHRHTYAHQALIPPADEAAGFIDVAEKAVDHIRNLTIDD